MQEKANSSKRNVGALSATHKVKPAKASTCVVLVFPGVKRKRDSVPCACVQVLRMADLNVVVQHVKGFAFMSNK